MQRAQKRDAAGSELFHFRKWVFPLGRSPSHDDWSSRPPSPSRANHRQDGSYASGNGASQEASTPRSSSPESTSGPANGNGRTSGPEVEEMTIDEIINGKVSDLFCCAPSLENSLLTRSRSQDSFPGLMGVVNAYVNSLNVDHVTRCEIRKYLDLIKHRAQGESASGTELPFWTWD
jgi:glutamate--cysteine ligase catalytic subunit